MPRSINSPVQHALVAYLKAARIAAFLTQQEVATALGRHQSFVATVESGQRRIDVVELLDLSEAIGFDIMELVGALKSARA